MKLTDPNYCDPFGVTKMLRNRDTIMRVAHDAPTLSTRVAILDALVSLDKIIAILQELEDATS